MWLDELNDLVVELSTKIDQHREIFQKSESATRYCLIDPLLTALGWDLSDPAQVLTEHTTGKGRVDYAMLPISGTPSLVVEAKSLDTPTEKARDQTIGYLFQDGIEYFAITNGNDWEVYGTRKKGPIEQKLVTAFKVTNMNQSTVMGMLWLWRGNFKDGEPVMPPPPPPKEDWPTAETHAGDNSTKTPPPVSTGKALSGLTNITGSAPPQTLTFPDGKTRPVGKWNRVQFAVVEWLVETGKLTEANCPLTNSRGTHLVHTSPHRKDGQRFTKPREIKPFWIDVCEDAVGHVRRAKNILAKVNVDPTTVHAVWPD